MSSQVIKGLCKKCMTVKVPQMWFYGWNWCWKGFIHSKGLGVFRLSNNRICRKSISQPDPLHTLCRRSLNNSFTIKATVICIWRENYFQNIRNKGVRLWFALGKDEFGHFWMFRSQGTQDRKSHAQTKTVLCIKVCGFFLVLWQSSSESSLRNQGQIVGPLFLAC